VKPGTLVTPSPAGASKDYVCLTPLKGSKNKIWPEWKVGELGIVIPGEENEYLVVILIPGGIMGVCFWDELVDIET